MLATQERELVSREGTPVRFSVQYLNATKGFKVMADVGRIVLPAVGILADAGADGNLAGLFSGKKAQGGGDMFARAAQALVANFDDAKVQTTIAELRNVTKVMDNGAWIELAKVFELRFRGEQLMLLKWLAFALEVQFGDFLSLRDSQGQAGSGDAANVPQA